MKKKVLILITAAFAGLYSCKSDKKTIDISISPEAGASFKQGEAVKIKASYPDDLKTDSVVYLLDSVKIGSREDSSAFTLNTDSMPLGSRLITAKIYHAGQIQETSTNITLLAAKAPQLLSYEVVNTFPHDTSSYTEGLEYHNGFLYESDGGYASEAEGRSSLRKTALATGKVLQQADVDPQVFAEGITVVGNKIVQLTYKEKIGFVYDKATFKILSKFSYTVGREGWGLCNDGQRIYNTDGTNRIFVLDINNYNQTGFIDVYDDQGPVNNLNELEYIDGKLFANVYTTNNILVIDPKTGAVLQKLDLTNLYPEPRSEPAEVLNGIAWDASGKRLFVTGKKWQHLYQIRIK